MTNTTSTPKTSGNFAREKLKHERIRAQLLSEITSGRLRPGDVLPTEKHLAEMLRVSRGTVRFALGELEDGGHVRRIQGKGTYVSDAVASQANPTTNMQPMALLVPHIDDSFYSSLVAEFDRAVHEVGRSALVCGTDNEIGKQADCLMRAMSQRVDGIVLNPAATAETPAYQIQLVQDAGIPVVLLHRGISGVSAPTLKIPFEEQGRLAAKLLLEAGHRHVALATIPGPSGEGYQRGLSETLSAAGASLPDEWVDHHWSVSEPGVHRPDYEQQMERLLDRMLSAAPRVTAICSTYDPISEVIYLVAMRRGLRIPEDLSIVSTGYSERRGAIRQCLTAITIDEKEATRRAVNYLEEMRGGKRPISQETVEYLKLDVCQGASLAAPVSG